MAARRAAEARRNTYHLEVGPAGGGPRRTLFARRTFTTSSGPPDTARLRRGRRGQHHRREDAPRPPDRRLGHELPHLPDGRWIAWTKQAARTPRTRSAWCRRQAASACWCRPSNRADSLAFFKPGVKRLFFLREPFSWAGGHSPAGRTISVPMSSLRRAPASAC